MVETTEQEVWRPGHLQWLNVLTGSDDVSGEHTDRQHGELISLIFFKEDRLILTLVVLPWIQLNSPGDLHLQYEI
jgi:hypothetical protein